MQADYEKVREAVQLADMDGVPYYMPAFNRLMDLLHMGREPTEVEQRVKELEYRLGIKHLGELEVLKP